MEELRIKRNDLQLSEIQRGGLKAFETLFRHCARLPSMDMGKPGKPNY